MKKLRPALRGVLAGVSLCAALTLACAASAQAKIIQILHCSDMELGLESTVSAYKFAAVAEKLRAAYPDATLTLSSGDNVIPGPFFGAGADNAVRDAMRAALGDSGLATGNGRPEMAIMNLIGFQASALGNHDLDAGTSVFKDFITPASSWMGVNFPFLTANIDFSGDANLKGCFTGEIRDVTSYVTNYKDSAAVSAAKKAAPSAVVTLKDGDKIGLVGVTTPLEGQLTSMGGLKVKGPVTDDMAALAATIQPTIDALTAQGINKIIVLAHLQQIANEKKLATLLKDVDVIVAGGSHTVMTDATDSLQPGDAAGEAYPYKTRNASGQDVVVVNTGDHYRYVGRLVADFNDAGVINAASVDPAVSGGWAVTDETIAKLYGAADPYAAGSAAARVKTICDAVRGVILAKDAQILGYTNVYLNGNRSDARTQETNLGDLTSDANLYAAQQLEPTYDVKVSIKNGGGIRDSIGTVIYPDPSNRNVFSYVPPQANAETGKKTGQISQLDLENSLRFNNKLTVLKLTADGLRQIIEHGVAAAAAGATPGQFPQVGGVTFTYDSSKPAYGRVLSINLVSADANGKTVITPVVADGKVVTNAPASIGVVTLSYMAYVQSAGSAAGGDNYPFPTLGTGFKDLAVNGAALDEQTAFKQYLAARHATKDNAFNVADTEAKLDKRIVDVTNTAYAGSPLPVEPSLAQRADFSAKKATYVETVKRNYKTLDATMSSDPVLSDIYPVSKGWVDLTIQLPYADEAKLANTTVDKLRFIKLAPGADLKTYKFTYARNPLAPQDGEWVIQKGSAFVAATDTVKNAGVASTLGDVKTCVLKVKAYLGEGSAYNVSGSTARIQDPALVAVDTASDSDDGDGGCVLNPAAGFGPEWLLLAAGPALIALRRRF